MSIEKVREYFKTKGIDGRIQEFEISSATVPLAAKALHCEESRIAKTLSLKYVFIRSSRKRWKNLKL